MSCQRLGLAILFVLYLSIESWASMHTATTEVGANTEDSITTAFVSSGGTTLINGEINSEQDADLLKFELIAVTSFSTKELEISPAHDPFGHGLAGDDDNTADNTADNNDLINNDSEILASLTTVADGLAGAEEAHNDIHISFYRVNVSQALQTAGSGVMPEPTTFTVWSLLGLTFAGTGSRRHRRT